MPFVKQNYAFTITVKCLPVVISLSCITRDEWDLILAMDVLHDVD